MTTRSLVFEKGKATVHSGALPLVLLLILPLVFLGAVAWGIWTFVQFETDRLLEGGRGAEIIPTLRRADIEAYVKELPAETASAVPARSAPPIPSPVSTPPPPVLPTQ